MILLDTHVWVRWLDPDAKPLPRSLHVSDQGRYLAEATYIEIRGQILLNSPNRYASAHCRELRT
ncbi:hypothetical protein BN874_100012 [Candidatus Contendobacter odensis Run_B_J11]|uniref:PIN domain-containing protein n=1 Tax=Candidatus Contendobacter odensis Run_B_J11 TaxID=1400861 RepID=A0A7U7J2E5_9GAMM|nr:hypothetical protein BN874_100012 [Candidatus Contendobacter odensis Run_B_J11]